MGGHSLGQAEEMPVARLVEGLGIELGQLATRVDELQHCVGDLLAAHHQLDADQLRNLQALDEIGQTLAALASVARVAAVATPEQATVAGEAIARVLPLSRLIAVLLPGVSASAASHVEEESFLFDATG